MKPDSIRGVGLPPRLGHRREDDLLRTPADVLAVDLDGAPADASGLAAGNGSHASALLIARLHGCVLGAVPLELPAGDTLCIEELRALIWDRLGERITSHLAADGVTLAPDRHTIPAGMVCRSAPLPAGPMASVVVSTCADVPATIACLNALLATRYRPFEVIVVDGRPSGSALREAVFGRFGEHGNVRVVDEPVRGSARARNTGLREAEGEILAIIDDDFIVDPDWLGHIARRLQDQPDAACVTGLILPMQLEGPGQLLIERPAGFGRGFEPRTFSLALRQDGDRLFPYDAGRFGSGANTAIRADVLDRLGGYAEELGAGTPARGGEDLDLFIRLLLAGERIAYEPAAVVWHRHPDGDGSARRQAFRRGVGLSALVAHRWMTGEDRAAMRAAVPAALRYLGDPHSRRNLSRGDRFPLSLGCWEALGVVMGPAGYLLSSSQGRRRSRSLRPQWIDQVELTEPPRDRAVPRQADGRRYAQAALLVRDHGQPLGFVRLDIRARELSGRRVHDAAQDRLAAAARWRQPPAAAPNGDRPRTAQGEISVVVCTRDGPGLRRTLTSILQASPAALEVLVVDNAPSSDAAHELVRELGDPRLRYVLEPAPGLSRARNRGITEARGRFVAFTDDDVIVDPLWLSGLEQGFNRDPDVACVTGLVAPAELETHAQIAFELTTGWGSRSAPQIWDRSDRRHEGRLFPYAAGRFGAGANFALDRDRVDVLGPFDEALGAGSPCRGGEDLDMFLRVLLAGFKLAYEPAALVWHVHRREPDVLRAQMFGYGAGLAAYACKQALNPVTRAEALRRIPPALARVTYLTCRGGSGGPGSGDLLRARLLGYLCGPVLYLRGREMAGQRHGHVRAWRVAMRPLAGRPLRNTPPDDHGGARNPRAARGSIIDPSD